MQLERMTTHTKPADREPSWIVVDAEGERLGRLASRIAHVLQGKHRPDYSRHQIAGDFVVVTNAKQVAVSGNKREQKIYYRHTGYVGHLRSRTLEEMLDRFPERVIELAVKGMLPRNKLGRLMLRRLKVYAAGEHPHEAQVNAGQGKLKQAPAGSATRKRRKTAETSATTAGAAEQEEKE
jgi:large subunit ribosomal protein L13